MSEQRCKAEDVYLRRLMPADAAAYTQLVIDSRDFLHPWVSPPSDDTKFQLMIERTLGPDYVSLAVCSSANDAIAGNINLSQIAYGNFCSAYLGFWVAPQFAGRGLMSIALRQVLHLAFEELGLHRLEANIQPENTRSKRLVERAGFRREGFSPRYLKINGEWRDHERWAICKEDLP